MSLRGTSLSTRIALICLGVTRNPEITLKLNLAKKSGEAARAKLTAASSGPLSQQALALKEASPSLHKTVSGRSSEN